MSTVELPWNQLSERLSVRVLHHPALLQAKKILLRSRHLQDALFRAQGPSVAIIGTRRPTDYGKAFVAKLIEQLSMSYPNLNILSGGAMGIDTEAHVQALRFGMSSQAWVVGPVDHPNPRTHARLFQRLVETPGCAVLTTDTLEPRLMGRTLRPYDWLKRNAWLAASADAIVVVEATIRSGTQSTVDSASQLGVPVFILPGPIFSPQSQGTNLMISMGCGRVVESIEFLIESLLVELS